MKPGGLGRKPHPDTPKAAQKYPIRTLPEYRTTSTIYRYWWENGAWLDQGATGTCVGNAFAHRRADGPVRVSGIDEAWAQELYVAASGDTTLQEGTSGILACRILQQRGIISGYHWVTSAQELRNTILTVGSVCVGTNWYSKMFYPVSQYSNAYLDVSGSLEGGHEYVINGINLNPASGPPFYRMKNSWNRTWAHGGTARIACEDLEDLVFNQDGDAVVITETKT